MNGTVFTLQQPLTIAQARILGFESPVADWASNGATPLATPQAVEGTNALSINLTANTQLTSIALASLGAIGSAVTIMLYVPSGVTAGEVRLAFKIPSRGVTLDDLGSRSLSTLQAGTFNELSFPLSALQRQRLGLSYSDLRFIVTLNAPAGVYRLDRLSVSGPSAPTSLRVNLPTTAGVPLTSVQLLAATRIEVTDRIATNTLLSFGSVKLGHNSTASQIVAAGELTLESSARAVRATSADYQGPANGIEQYEELQGPLLSTTVTWDVVVPQTNGGDVTIGPDAANAVLAPGRYRTIRVQPRSTLRLGPGQYIFENLFVEPDRNYLEVNASGTTFVYVTKQLSFKGQTRTIGAGGNFALVYLGQDPTVLEGDINGAFIAPNASVRLATLATGARHQGSFFAKSLLLSPDVALTFKPANILVDRFTETLPECADALSAGATDYLNLERASLRYCSGLEDGCELELQARANTHYRLAAFNVLTDAFTAARYVGVAQDRTTKLRHSRASAQYACQVLAGDADNDLVPNGTDVCPGTPPLTPTDAVGCPRPLPPAPRDEVVKEILEKVDISFAKNCIDTPAPAPPSIERGVSFSSLSTSGGLFVSFTSIEDNDCPSYYEAEFEMRSPEVLDPNGQYQAARFRIANLEYNREGRTPTLSGWRASYGVAFEGPWDSTLKRPVSGRPNPDALFEFLWSEVPSFVRVRVRGYLPSGVRSDWSQWSQWNLHIEVER